MNEKPTITKAIAPNYPPDLQTNDAELDSSSDEKTRINQLEKRQRDNAEEQAFATPNDSNSDACDRGNA